MNNGLSLEAVLTLMLFDINTNDPLLTSAIKLVYMDDICLAIVRRSFGAGVLPVISL